MCSSKRPKILAPPPPPPPPEAAPAQIVETDQGNANSLAAKNATDKVLEVPTLGLSGDRFYAPMWTDKEMAEYTGSVMFIDPSGRGADETGYAIVKFLHGYLSLVDAGGFHEGYSPSTLQKLSDPGQSHIKIQQNQYNRMISN